MNSKYATPQSAVAVAIAIALLVLASVLVLSSCGSPPQPTPSVATETPEPTRPPSQDGVWLLPNSQVSRIYDERYNVVCYIYSYQSRAGYGDSVDITSNGGIFCLIPQGR